MFKVSAFHTDTVTNGRLLCQWYADQSGAIHESVILSSGLRHGTLALAKCRRSRSRPDWRPVGFLRPMKSSVSADRQQRSMASRRIVLLKREESVQRPDDW